MKRKIKINLLFKKDGRLNQARITLNREILQQLELNEFNNDVIIKTIGDEVLIYSDNNSEDIDEKTTYKRKLIYDKGGKNKEYIACKLSIPLQLVKKMEITKESNEVEIEILNKKMTIRQIGGEKMGKGQMITVKVNKGGIGKTTLSAWIAHGLADLGYKTCILTSDAQNNVLDITFKEGKKPLFDRGLKSWVLNNKGEKIRIRKNLDFIPLESNVFGSHFLKQLPIFLENLKNEYDFIINDSIPAMKLDKEFVQVSEKIIIPAFCDRSTVEGIINVIEEEGIEKIFAIIVNKYENVETQNKYYQQLKNILKDTDILFPEPIKNKSIIAKTMDSGRTIWESNSKQVEEVQDILTLIIYELIGGNKNE